MSTLTNTVPFAILALAAAQAASASATTYDNRAAWELDAGAAPTLETFESEALGNVPFPSTLDSGLGVGLASGAVTAAVSLDEPGIGQVNTTPGGRHSLHYGDEPQTGSYTAMFTLASDVEAFGFDISGWQPTLSAGGPTGGMNVTLYDDGMIVDDFFLMRDVSIFDVSFVGLVSSAAFDEVRLSISQLGSVGSNPVADFVAFDDVAWAVPSPGAATLLALGGAAAMRRRR